MPDETQPVTEATTPTVTETATPVATTETTEETIKVIYYGDKDFTPRSELYFPLWMPVGGFTVYSSPVPTPGDENPTEMPNMLTKPQLMQLLASLDYWQEYECLKFDYQPTEEDTKAFEALAVSPAATELIAGDSNAVVLAAIADLKQVLETKLDELKKTLGSTTTSRRSSG